MVNNDWRGGQAFAREPRVVVEHPRPLVHITGGRRSTAVSMHSRTIDLPFINSRTPPYPPCTPSDVSSRLGVSSAFRHTLPWLSLEHHNVTTGAPKTPTTISITAGQPVPPLPRPSIPQLHVSMFSINCQGLCRRLTGLSSMIGGFLYPPA